MLVNILNKNYYSQKLSAERLKFCYEIAPPRIKQYLKAEINFVLDGINCFDHILELGCGYGRVLRNLRKKSRTIIGIDISFESLQLARTFIAKNQSNYILQMNAAELGFYDQTFEAVICIQNGISAFKVNLQKLIGEAIRVTRPGGIVLFSSYSDNFWEDRLEWFEIQASHGLIGEIDKDATGNGTIVCTDGFKATTLTPETFWTIISNFNVEHKVTEVDNSCIFYEILVE